MTEQLRPKISTKIASNSRESSPRYLGRLARAAALAIPAVFLMASREVGYAGEPPASASFVVLTPDQADACVHAFVLGNRVTNALAQSLGIEQSSWASAGTSGNTVICSRLPDMSSCEIRRPGPEQRISPGELYRNDAAVEAQRNSDGTLDVTLLENGLWKSLSAPKAPLNPLLDVIKGFCQLSPTS